jgi:hypothetical protein
MAQRRLGAAGRQGTDKTWTGWVGWRVDDRLGGFALRRRAFGASLIVLA